MRAWYSLLWFLFFLLIFFVILSYNNDAVKIQSNISFSNLENIEWELYFSPSYDYTWFEDYLLTTNEELKVYLYSFIYNPLISSFKDIANSWVDIQIVIENNKFNHDDEDYYELLNSFSWFQNIEIKNDEDLDTNFMHAKTFLLDDKFIIQTANLTYSAFFRSAEIFFVSQDKDVLDSLNYIFQQDWNWNNIDENKIHDNLIVCPFDCRSDFLEYINKADESIKVFIQSLSDRQIIDWLDSFEWELKIMLADNNSNYSNKDIFSSDELQFLSEPYLHAKSILIDDKYLIVWSTNFTQNSIDNNREINIVLIDPELISDFRSYFNRYWNW